MANQFASERNLDFLLYEVFAVEDLTAYEEFAEHSREGFELVVGTAARVARDQLYPYLVEMDREAPEMVDGRVRVHPMVRGWMRSCGEGGWIAACESFDHGGQQLPVMINTACRFLFAAANYSASVYPFLTAGAARLILSFGADELRETFVPEMLAGNWQGTMALTEPQAGSSLSDIRSQATPSEAGYYRMKGQKIFISGGDHDGVDNHVHLLLARIAGAPAGVKGISLFVVPRRRPTAGGGLEFNDVSTAAVYHKLGYRGCPITQLSLGENDDCRGWLVGEPHQGLSYMFQMMNEARIDVGLSAAAIASAAYYASLEYARERPQGRRLDDKRPDQPPVAIVEHPDVRRLLLFQRAIVEGSLGLLMQCSCYVDVAKAAPAAAERERAALLLDLLTPIAKSYPSEMGILSASQGLQILGGYGYCDEFPLEQYYRDMRIHPIHEGTTAIHGLDLLGRKVRMGRGAALEAFVVEVEKDLDDAVNLEELGAMVSQLSGELAALKETTAALLALREQAGPGMGLADATLYLELFSLVAIAWQWLKQAAVARRRGAKSGLSAEQKAFYEGKLLSCRYFFAYELPKTAALHRRLQQADGLTLKLDDNCLN